MPSKVRGHNYILLAEMPSKVRGHNYVLLAEMPSKVRGHNYITLATATATSDRLLPQPQATDFCHSHRPPTFATATGHRLLLQPQRRPPAAGLAWTGRWNRFQRAKTILYYRFVKTANASVALYAMKAAFSAQLTTDAPLPMPECRCPITPCLNVDAPLPHA